MNVDYKHLGDVKICLSYIILCCVYFNIHFNYYWCMQKILFVLFIAAFNAFSSSLLVKGRGPLLSCLLLLI